MKFCLLFISVDNKLKFDRYSFDGIWNGSLSHADLVKIAALPEEEVTIVSVELKDDWNCRAVAELANDCNDFDESTFETWQEDHEDYPEDNPEPEQQFKKTFYPLLQQYSVEDLKELIMNNWCFFSALNHDADVLRQKLSEWRTLYRTVIFVQSGELLAECDKLFTGNGTPVFPDCDGEAVIDYLKQWDCPEYADDDIGVKVPTIGRSDSHYYKDGYTLLYNTSVGGCYLLYRKANKQELDDFYNK